MDDQQKLLLEIQSNAGNAVGDLQKLVDTLGKLSGQTEKTKQEAHKASQGFTDLQAKIVATYAAFGILGQAYNTAIGTIRRGTDATLGQARAFAEYNQQLKNVTTQLGITSQFYQVLEARLQRLGLGTDAARASLFIFNRTVEAARQGAGEAAEVIQRLNVNVDRTRNIEAIYLDVAKAITELGSSTERAQAAQTLFGRQGAQQIVVLEELAQGSREFEQRLKSLGIVMDQNMVQSANRADKALSEMNEAMKGLDTQWQRAMTETFAPTIENASKLLTTMAEKVNGSRIEVNAFIEATTIMALMIVGPAGAVAAVTALIKAIGALKLAFTGLQLAAGPLGWLTALIGALGSAALAWGLFGDKVDEAADKLERAKGIAKGDKYNQFWQTGEEPNWPLPTTGGDPRDIADGRDFGVSASAASPARDTDAQIQRGRQALQEYEQALAQAAIAEAERTRGTIAGIQERLKWRQHEIEQERLFAVEDAQRIADSTARDQEVASINAASQRAQDAARLEAQSQTEQASLDLSDAFGQQALEHLEAMGEQRLALHRIQAQAQLDLQQISFDEYFALQRQFATEEYQLAVERNERQLALARAGTAERKAILDEREQLELEHQVKLAEIDADAARTARQQQDTIRDLKDTVEAVHLEAFGTPAQQRIQALMVEQGRLIKQLGEAGLVGEIEKVRKAYARLIAEATPGFVNLGRTISGSVAGGVTDLISGAGSAKDALEGTSDAISGSFTKAFEGALAEKLNFDETLNVNFLKDIPGMAAKGASAIGQIFSNLFDYISGGTGVGAQVSVTESAATGSSGGGGFNLGSFGSFGGGGSATTTLAGGGSLNVGALAGIYGGAIGGVTAGTGVAGAAIGGAAGGASTIASSGVGAAAGGAGAGVPWALIVMAIVNAFIGGITAIKKERKQFGATDDSVFQAAVGGYIEGVFGTVGMDGLGKAVGNLAEKSPVAASILDLVFGGGWTIVARKAGAFKAPSKGKQSKKLINEYLQETDTFFPVQTAIQSGGLASLRTTGFELPQTIAESQAFEAMGYGKIRSFEDNDNQLASGVIGFIDKSVTNLEGVDDALDRRAKPGVSELRLGPALGLAQVLLGSTPGATPTDIAYAASAMTSSLMATGMSAKEAKAEFRGLADDAGVTLPNAMLTLRKQGFEGGIDSIEQMKASIAGVVEVFHDDLPPGLDLTALAMKHVSEVAKGVNDVHGTVIFNARELIDETERLVVTYQARVSTMGQGFNEGINAALDSFLVAHQLAKTALDTTPQQDLAMSQSGKPIIAQIVGAVAGGEKQFKGSMMASFGQALRQDLITSAYERITESKDVNTPWNKLTSGELNMADLPATLEQLWKDVNKEIRAAVIPLAMMDDYFATMAENSEEMGVNLGDVATQIDGLVRGALNSALQSYFALNDEAEANAAAAAQAEQERQSRMAFLTVSIDQARIFGDEIRAAELAMEQQTLAAIQVNQDVVESIDEVYQKAIKEGLQEALIQGMIEAIAGSGAMQAALVPYFDALQNYVDALAGGNHREISAARKKLEREANRAEETLLLGGSLTFPDELVPNLSSHDANIAGLLDVPGSNAALLGGGSANGQGGSFGGIVVNVTGNYIGDQATADHLVAQIEATMLQRMQMNNLVGH